MTKSSNEMAPVAQRRLVLGLIGTGLLAPLGACGKGSRTMEKGINLSVVLNAYLTRSIYDIYFNKEDLGVTAPYGSTGIITGVHVPFGAQTLSWRLGGPEGAPNNGDTVHVKNLLTIKPEQILPTTRYIGIHVYPDFTAEITVCDDMPELTPRGRLLLKNRATPYAGV